jgi:glutathione S-transferase
MILIYGDSQSGNCLKVKYTADRLAIPYAWEEVDVMKGESRTPDFLEKNIQGQVPVVRLEDGSHLAQSNAIICYLARGSALLPDDPRARSRVDEWLFWEQNGHEFFVAGTIFQTVYLKKPFAEREAWRVARAEGALDLMERVLDARPFFAGGAMTVADIALLAYTRRAPLGGFDLSGRPATRAWITRCEGELGLDPLAQVQ